MAVTAIAYQQTKGANLYHNFFLRCLQASKYLVLGYYPRKTFSLQIELVMVRCSQMLERDSLTPNLAATRLTTGMTCKALYGSSSHTFGSHAHNT